MTRWRGWKAVIRDVVIFWLSTVIGVLLLFLAGGLKLPLTAICLATLVPGIIGFCISGCMMGDNRWKHLATVAVFVWLTIFVNTIFTPLTFIQWLFGIVIIFMMMAIGGGLSFLFMKSKLK